MWQKRKTTQNLCLADPITVNARDSSDNERRAIFLKNAGGNNIDVIRNVNYSSHQQLQNHYHNHRSPPRGVEYSLPWHGTTSGPREGEFVFLEMYSSRSRWFVRLHMTQKQPEPPPSVIINFLCVTKFQRKFAFSWPTIHFHLRGKQERDGDSKYSPEIIIRILVRIP